MELVGAIIDAIKCLGDPTCRYIDHQRKLEERMNDLRIRADRLKALKSDIELKKRAELRWGKITRKEVENWLITVENIINVEMEDYNQREQNVSCFSRACLAKRVAQAVEKVEGIIEEGRGFAGPLVIVNPYISGVPLELEHLEGETAAKAEIRSYLMGDETGMIGVWGMGGVGKTTIMKHIHNQLLQEAKTLFDKVIWVTVSKALNITKIQQDIAEQVNIEDFPKSEPERVAVLKDKLRQIRYVLILDDVWEAFNLLDVGIPEPTSSSGSKLVLTSRSSDVCRSMDCKGVKVQPLSNEESMKLFLKHVGQEVEQISSLAQILGDIVQECDGLPLALVVIARSMKGIYDHREWTNALRELRNHVKSVRGTDEEIYERLKFSYDRLGDSKIQNCFLYCSLYPEDRIISSVELIENWIDEGFLETGSRQELSDRGHVILNKLQNNCLLEKDDDRDNVKMHDVMRDTALYIKSSRFMVKAGIGLEEVPSKQEWKEDLEKVSLMYNSIAEIPPDFSPNCEDLSTLLLRGNRSLLRISESFFDHMPTLCILDLSYTKIEQLPNSVSNLEKLHALLLRGCGNLRHVPSLEKLKALRKLDLCFTAIERVPHGLEMSASLTYLNLFTECLQEFPMSILPKHSCLQYLMLDVKSSIVKMKGFEAARLRKLETFDGRFNELIDFNTYCKSMQGRTLTSYLLVLAPLEARFEVRPFGGIVNKVILQCDEASDPRIAIKIAAECSGVYHLSFDTVKKRLQVVGDVDPVYISRKLRKKVGHTEFITVGPGRLYKFPDLPLLPQKDVILSGCQARREDPVVLPTDLRFLRIFECHNARSLSDISLFFQQKNELRSCSIHGCREIESLLDLSSWSLPGSPLENLEQLWLERLDNLHMLVKPGEASVGSISSSLPMPGIFSHLKSFQIEGCSNMKQLFPFELAHDLQNLERLEVDNCGQMEEIIASKIEDENHKGKETYSPTMLCLPKLWNLELKNLPELKSICSPNGVMTCDSLEDLRVLKCPNLKRMPLNLPLFDDSGQSLSCPLHGIFIDSRKWWKSVKWDYPNAKNILQDWLVLLN